MLYPQLLAETSSSVETASQTSDPISFQTALLVIIASALLLVAKNLASLNHRISSVESGKTSNNRQDGAIGTQHSAMPAGMVAPEVVAAISAAIHTTLKGNHRIISVGQICASRQAWSAEGRRQVFSSHKVR